MTENRPLINSQEQNQSLDSLMTQSNILLDLMYADEEEEEEENGIILSSIENKAIASNLHYTNSPTIRDLPYTLETPGSISSKRKLQDTFSPTFGSLTSVNSPLLEMRTPTEIKSSFFDTSEEPEKIRYDENGSLENNVSSLKIDPHGIVRNEKKAIQVKYEDVNTPIQIKNEHIDSSVMAKSEYEESSIYNTNKYANTPIHINNGHVDSPIKYPNLSYTKPNVHSNQFSMPLVPPLRQDNHRAKTTVPSFEVRNGPQRHTVRESENININNVEYKVLKEVGRGSSGKVYQVFSHEKGEFYALKWIEIKRQDDVQAIMNEIELLRSLRNEERIVAILDYCPTPQTIFIIMEFGQIDLAHLIQKQLRKKWDIAFIRYYWKQMLECVDSIHHKNIVHSDLKPANFVLVKGWLKLIDFGIAKKFADDTTNIYRGIQVGTVNYMSPESLLDVNEGKDNESLMRLGRPSDVWSLGCILYQMVYGKTPFYHLKLPQKLICIPNPDYAISFPSTAQNEEDEAPVQIPATLLQLLRTCLNRNPAFRPVPTELLRHPFVTEF